MENGATSEVSCGQTIFLFLLAVQKQDYKECFEAFSLKMEHQHKWINCKNAEYLEKLKEV